MIFGYARVSTEDQHLDRQIEALKNYGCDEIHTEKISSQAKNRPQWDLLKVKLRKGDVLVIKELSRLCRSLPDFVRITEFLVEKEVNMVVLDGSLDMNSTFGYFTINLLALIADMERKLILEKTAEGRAAAKKRGVQFGRPKGIPENNLSKAARVVELWHQGKYSIQDIADQVGCHRTTVYDYLKKMNINYAEKPKPKDDYQAKVITAKELHLST